MRNIIAAAFAFVVLIGIANPAAATGPNYSDGKPASVSAQKAACKKTSGDTYRACKELATLPDWWSVTLDSQGQYVHTHVVNGVTLINNLRKVQPYSTLKQEFRNNIKAYRDQHVKVPMNV